MAARAGVNPESLLQERKTKGSWRLVADSATVSVQPTAGKATDALKANAADGLLARAVVDDLLLRYHFHGGPELTALRKAGAGNQELVLAGLIAAKTGQPAMQLYREVKGGGASWGGLLQRAKISPADIQSEVTLLIMKSSAPKSR